MKDYAMQAGRGCGGRGGVKEQRKQRGTSSTGWMDHALIPQLPTWSGCAAIKSFCKRKKRLTAGKLGAGGVAVVSLSLLWLRSSAIGSIYGAM